MNPREFLDVADDLAAGIREGDWRSAVSRAYYAAFHVARRLLRGGGFVVPSGDQVHAYCWLRLSNAGHPDVQEAGRGLSDLRTERNESDYDIDFPFPHADAVDAAHRADKIIKLLELVAADSVLLAQVVAAVRVYERDVLVQVTWRP
jgi:uncharacterized protein (UPF0332 family)